MLCNSRIRFTFASVNKDNNYLYLKLNILERHINRKEKGNPDGRIPFLIFLRSGAIIQCFTT